MSDIADQSVVDIDGITNLTLAFMATKTQEMLDPARGRRYCEDCGQPIPESRLKAIPGATRCVKCQALYESKK